MIRALLFAGGTIVLAWLSRAWLARPASHGFYRFFAWECILGLLLLNFRGIRAWFADPLSPHQLLSWILLFGSIVPVTWGAYLLRTQGRAGLAPDDRELYDFEKTTRLVTTGVFRYVRHPLYSSLLLLAWGVFAKRPSWTAAALAIGASACLFGTAKVEEVENRLYFGDAYGVYVQRSKMFIPFLF